MPPAQCLGGALVDPHDPRTAGGEAQPHQPGAAAAVVCREEGSHVLPLHSRGEVLDRGHHGGGAGGGGQLGDRKSTRLNSSHVATSYAVFCLKKKNKNA